MLNPEAAKQQANNANPAAAKHPRRRANTLESGTMQSLRPGRRGRGAIGAGAGSSVRRRDSSGSSNARGATPVLGRRSDAPLERAASSQSIFYPDSPGSLFQVHSVIQSTSNCICMCTRMCMPIFAPVHAAFLTIVP